MANPQRGEALFSQYIDAVGFACSTCHNVVGDEVKIGPSLYGIPQRAAERVPGEGPYTYLYNSIHNSQAYIVPGFENAVHMPHYAGLDGSPVVLSDAQIYDLVAYLMTLNAP
ncbi:MAG: cytochrome c [Anaerolineae bacterium]|nr:cytochrome c [Anaerolineae bacterium]